MEFCPETLQDRIDANNHSLKEAVIPKSSPNSHMFDIYFSPQGKSEAVNADFEWVLPSWTSIGSQS